MTVRREPEFLDRRLVDLLHKQALIEHGGLGGVRDSYGIESAVGHAYNVWNYHVGVDLFDVAACYAHGLGQAQGYLYQADFAFTPSAKSYVSQLTANIAEGVRHPRSKRIGI